MAQSDTIERAVKSQSEWRKDFWEHVISRHPIEEGHAKSTKLAYRWRMIPRHRLVVVQYVAATGVGVFIRGEKGSKTTEVQQRLNPHASKLRNKLGPGLLSWNDPIYFFHSRKRINALNVANWDKMADWLHTKADAYQDAIQRVMGGTA